MSMIKGIKYGKEHRKPYYGSKAIDETCRNHGSCLWCEENRMYKNIKRIQYMDSQMQDFFQDSEKSPFLVVVYNSYGAEIFYHRPSQFVKTNFYEI